jgi:hypothetical protein
MKKDNTLDFDLISGVLGYFQPAGRYKKIVGMTNDPRLEIFDPISAIMGCITTTANGAAMAA